MAAIDKIYINKFEDYLLFKEWCNNQPKIKDKYGSEMFFIRLSFFSIISFTKW